MRGVISLRLRQVSSHQNKRLRYLNTFQILLSNRIVSRNILLIGIGADTSNVRKMPPVTADGKFAYIPFPEKHTPAVSDDAPTYGDGILYRKSVPKEHAESMIDLVGGWVKPDADDEKKKEDDEAKAHPVHHDPDFDNLSFGEGTRLDTPLKKTETDTGVTEGDILAFYTGLHRRSFIDCRSSHRYIIGYFTLKQDPLYLGEPDSEQFAGATIIRDRAEREEKLKEHNPAHYHRLKANGDIYAINEPDGLSEYEDPNGMLLFIGDKKKPGGLLDKAVQISKPNTSTTNYRSEDEFTKMLYPDEDERPDEGLYLGGRKPTHLIKDADPDALIDFINKRR